MVFKFLSVKSHKDLTVNVINALTWEEKRFRMLLPLKPCLGQRCHKKLTKRLTENFILHSSSRHYHVDKGAVGSLKIYIIIS